MTFDASTALEVEFNDNVGLSEDRRRSDVIFRSSLRLDSRWHVSQLNTLRFALGIGFAKYANHSELDSSSVLVDPGSEISFDLYLGGNLKLNFHDRFAIVQNPLDEPNLSNITRFDRLQNSVGVSALWDLNDLQLVVGYDHFDYRSLGSEFDFLDRQEEQFYASANLTLSDAIAVGLDASGALVDFRDDYNNDGYTYSAGPHLEAVLSPYSRARVSAGYQGMQFDDSGESGDRSDFSGWYANVALAQRVNQHWSHTVTIGHEARLGLAVNFAEYSYARYLAQWRVNSRMNAAFEGFVEDADESGGHQQASEHAFRWGLGASVSWRLGSRVSMALQYRFVDKDSDQILRSYYQNLGMLTVSYDF